MTDSWYMLGQLEEQVATLGEVPSAERANRLMLALASCVSDVVGSPAQRATLADGAHRAASLLDRMRARHEIDEASPSYVAGRLATIVDILTLLVRSRAIDDLPERAMAELKTLQALYEAPLSNAKVAAVRKITEEAACRSLRTCRELDLVETERVGRENRNRLTPLGLALFDDGYLPPHDGDIRYDMDSVVRRASREQLTKHAELPKLDIQ